ncbi:noncanonical pyrimidine nucleotidase, YjjG family, partial [Erysipelothrix rhusiopathiae]|nr:noncanonical pyrimidine nucleotidase, YjjG family [Erysipelothrix rhusiopathiae]
MTYTTLLFDIDNTLLNFKESETIALKQLFETLKVPYTKEVLDYYYDVNHMLWEAHERGEINQQTILDERF